MKSSCILYKHTGSSLKLVVQRTPFSRKKVERERESLSVDAAAAAAAAAVCMIEGRERVPSSAARTHKLLLLHAESSFVSSPYFIGWI